MAMEFIPYQATLTLRDEAASYVLLAVLEEEIERMQEEFRQAVPKNVKA